MSIEEDLKYLESVIKSIPDGYFVSSFYFNWDGRHCDGPEYGIIIGVDCFLSAEHGDLDSNGAGHWRMIKLGTRKELTAPVLYDGLSRMMLRDIMKK
jgi:hypothetical protein